MSFPIPPARLFRSLRLPASAVAPPSIAVRAFARSAPLSNGSFPRRIGFSHSRPAPLAGPSLPPLRTPLLLARFKSTAPPAPAEPSPPPINSNSVALEKEDAADLDPVLAAATAKPKIQLGEVRRLMQLARPEYKVIGLALSLVRTLSLPSQTSTHPLL